MPDSVYNALIFSAAILGLAICYAEGMRRRDKRRRARTLKFSQERERRYQEFFEKDRRATQIRTHEQMRKAHRSHPVTANWHGKDGGEAA